MRSPRSPWLRRFLVAGVMAFALGWLPYQVYGHTGLAHLVKLRGELATLRRDNASLRADNARLRAELDLSDDDDLGTVERVARDELGLVKPGEVVFKIVADAPAATGMKP